MFHGTVCLFISPDLDGYRAPQRRHSPFKTLHGSKALLEESVEDHCLNTECHR